MELSVSSVLKPTQQAGPNRTQLSGPKVESSHQAIPPCPQSEDCLFPMSSFQAKYTTIAGASFPYLGQYPWRWILHG